MYIKTIQLWKRKWKHRPPSQSRFLASFQHELYVLYVDGYSALSMLVCSLLTFLRWPQGFVVWPTNGIFVHFWGVPVEMLKVGVVISFCLVPKWFTCTPFKEPWPCWNTRIINLIGSVISGEYYHTLLPQMQCCLEAEWFECHLWDLFKKKKKIYHSVCLFNFPYTKNAAYWKQYYIIHLWTSTWQASSRHIAQISHSEFRHNQKTG